MALSVSRATTLATSEVVRKGRFPTRRDVIRSTSDGGLRKDIFLVTSYLKNVLRFSLHWAVLPFLVIYQVEISFYQMNL